MKKKEQLTKAVKELAPIIRNAVNQASDDVERIAKEHNIDANTLLINALGMVLLGGCLNADASTMILQSNKTSWLAIGPIDAVKQGGSVEEGTRAVMEGVIRLIGISEEFECDCTTCKTEQVQETDSHNEKIRSETLKEIENKVIH